MMTEKCEVFDVKSYMDIRKKRVERALDDYLPPGDTRPAVLHRSVRYSVFSGGKRFRPILCIACFEACGGEGDRVLPVACAIEMIHTYSLIHDDLPCMDDDDLRRGKPTNHRVFGEAVAVLAGDALLTSAIDLIVRESPDVLGAEGTLGVLESMLHGIGTEGMVAGQVVDMESEGKGGDPETVEYIHLHKTSALIEASGRCGAMVAGAGASEIEQVSRYGRNLGLAFQIIDDILDAEGRFGNLKSGSALDERRRKATYPGVFGLEKSREMARSLIGEAKDCVAVMGDSALPLKSMADLVLKRAF
jgi:geranylgeranyl diphosphate synthase type II